VVGENSTLVYSPTTFSRFLPKLPSPLSADSPSAAVFLPERRSRAALIAEVSVPQNFPSFFLTPSLFLRRSGVPHLFSPASVRYGFDFRSLSCPVQATAAPFPGL